MSENTSIFLDIKIVLSGSLKDKSVSLHPHVKYCTSGTKLYLACFSLIKNDLVRKLIWIHKKQKFMLRGKLSICAIKSKIKPNKGRLQKKNSKKSDIVTKGR